MLHSKYVFKIQNCFTMIGKTALKFSDFIYIQKIFLCILKLNHNLCTFSVMLSVTENCTKISQELHVPQIFICYLLGTLWFGGIKITLYVSIILVVTVSNLLKMALVSVQKDDNKNVWFWPLYQEQSSHLNYNFQRILNVQIRILGFTKNWLIKLYYLYTIVIILIY